ncbi:MAG TPA: PAS domain S-box protein [Steroidobacteraceae bacterium]|nr:PAS domain S-box protein [Steroidobacteraceae bacterium]
MEPAARRSIGELYAWAFGHNPHGIAVLDADTGAIVLANDAYARLLGKRPEELHGRSRSSLYPPSEHASLRAATDSADLTGTSRLKTCVLHSDGSVIPVALCLAPIRDGAGHVTHRIETVQDLRPQLHAEGLQRDREVREGSAERFRQLAHGAPIGILLMDEEGKLEYANPHWLQITALSLEQARQQGWSGAVHPEDRSRVREAWSPLDAAMPLSLEFRYQRPGGEVRWVQSRAAALRDDGGESAGYIAVDVDVTDQVRQRAAIDGFHARIRGLANRLEHLREDERADLARKLHGTLRQDLTTLKAHIETLRGRPSKSAPAKPSLEPVARLADGCLEQLRRIAFELQPPGVEDLGLEAVMKRFADECAEQSSLSVELSTAGLPADLDRRRSLALYRVFQEALTNVIRHARAKKVEARIWLQDGTVRLRVSDDGVGVGENDRSKAGAFGLLAISERLAELGGTLRVLGVAGRGTTVEASLPHERVKRISRAR